MPYRKRYNRKTKRSMKRKYRRRRGLKTSVRKISGVLPDIMRTKLKYVWQGNLTSAITQVVSNVFRGNSINDPDSTGVGGQPYGHDQWNSFYNTYRVYASSIVIQADSEDADNGCIVGVVPLNGTAGAAEVAAYMEYPYSRSRNIGISNGANKCIVKNYMETSKIKGVKAINYTQDYTATFNSNPASQWYWHLWVGPTDGSGFPNVNCTVTITYYVELFDRRTLTRS